ncbi:MAG: hypothetical protein L3J41_14870 [Melioribacteraceae bacterium]|nr:hypothetical protein [Melioribacteraceae bacterium]
MNNTSSKNRLLEIINSLKKQKSYFNYDEISVLLKNKNIQLTNSTIKTYLHSFTKNEVIFNAGKGWYSSIEKQFQLNKEPIKDIIKTINEKYPLLTFSAWSTEQLNPFTHHILSKFVSFIYVDLDFIKIIADFLRESGYNVFEKPTKSEIEKQFKIVNKTVIILPSIYNQPKINEYFAPIEKILVDFLMENRNFKIMELSETEKVFNNVLTSGRVNIATILSYSKRRKFTNNEIINQLRLNGLGVYS